MVWKIVIILHMCKCNKDTSLTIHFQQFTWEKLGFFVTGQENYPLYRQAGQSKGNKKTNFHLLEVKTQIDEEKEWKELSFSIKSSTPCDTLRQGSPCRYIREHAVVRLLEIINNCINFTALWLNLHLLSYNGCSSFNAHKHCQKHSRWPFS